MVRDWVVKVDDHGMVVIGECDKPTDAYLVNAEADGSFALVERLDPPLPDAEIPDDDGGLNSHGEDAAYLLCPQPESTQQRYEEPKSVPVDAELVHQPDHEEQPEVRGSWTESTSPSALDYWVIQNRDAHAMFRRLSASGRRTAASP
jgi:hypothetical protein